jgi:hypothetical protein
MAVGEQAQKGEELLSFVPLEEGNGLKVIDRIERRHLAIETGGPVSPDQSSTDEFAFPVDEAVSIETNRLFIPDELCVIVWNSLGFMISEITGDETKELPKDRYLFEIPGPVRLYVTLDESCSIDMSGDGILIESDIPTEVSIGARSYHKQPAATITTSENVEDLMQAISYFSSGLKTTSCERSYPSHRGHPPTLEVGDELEIPSVLTRPETGVSIQVPRDLGSVFTVATLAYYLGAEVVPGNEARIVTDQGFVHQLDDTSRTFENEVERVLKQIFFLDCLTRTEGLYQIELHERNQVEPRINLDFAELYDEPLSAQIEAYLELPYRIVEPNLPKWKLTAHVMPRFEHVETLPFLVNDLAVINIPDTRYVGQSRAQTLAVEDFVRGSNDYSRAMTRSTVESAPTPSLVRVEEVDSMEQTWIGEGAPLGASKGISEAFYNRLDRPPSDDDIDITVVCNAAEMGQESDLVNEVYGSREQLPFDVSIHRELRVQELEEILKEETDFFHYIGHIDAGGFECADGRFDASSLGETGVDVFFLNACTSYEQGKRLIEAGSIAGVVTLQDIINSGAERVGMTLARLLNGGFPLRAAMSIARTESIMGGHYLVIGDGSIDIAQPKGFVPALSKVNKIGDVWELEYISFPTHENGMGTVSTPFIEGCDEYYLTSGHNVDFQLDDNDLRDFFQLEEGPVRIGNELTWSTEFEP